MRCSLLLLSTYLDGELNDKRAVELDAHLVGCTRCQSGLGYLREESQRIAGLARVRVPEHSAHALLVHVGLLDDEAPLPGQAPEPFIEPEDPDAPPWLGSAPGKALPWRPPVRATVPPAAPPSLEPVRSGSPIATLDKPPPLRTRAPLAEQPVATLDTHVERHDEAQLEVPGIALPPATEVVRPLAPVDHDTIAQPPTPPSWAVSQTRRRSWLGRQIAELRDVYAVRWAMLRGLGKTDATFEFDLDAAPHAGPASATAFSPTGTLADALDADVLDEVETAPEPPPVRQAVPPPPLRPAGRHARTLASARPRLPAISLDRRLTIYAGGVALLLIVGLLTGKQLQTPQTTATRPPVASAPARPSIAPATAAATPAPSLGPSPLELTGAQAAGTGALGFAVTDLRYGVHPSDFRIVFDFTSSGSAGSHDSPSVTAGFGNPTTLYVILARVLPGTVVPPPPGGVVTGVTLLPRSPIAGHVVYQVTLSRAATLSMLYLSGPTRLVIDLR